MKIKTFSVGQLQTNSYLLWDEESLDAVIIDPGDEGEFLSEQVVSHNLNLTHILLTHGHFDHVLGIIPLHLNFNAKIALHPDDVSLYSNSHKSAKHWVNLSFPPPPTPTHLLKKGEGIAVGSLELIVIEVPGHTSGSVCFHARQSRILFTGDLLFKDGVGRTDFSYSSSADLHKSLDKIAKLPPDTIIYPGHGEKSTIGRELANY